MTSQIKNLVIYHKDCCDGFGSAWVARKFFLPNDPNMDNTIFIAANYQERFSSHTNDILIHDQNIYILDFSYPRAELEFINNQCRSLVVLDHHDTAEKELKGLDYCRFEKSQSGIMMTWNHFFADKPVPKIVSFIQDYDLWKFELKDSEAINANIHAMQKTFEQYENIYQRLEMPTMLEDFVKEGNAILRLTNMQIDKALKNAIPMIIDNYSIFGINNPTHISLAVGRLSENLPFAAGFFRIKDGWSVSLRSNKKNPAAIHVGEIAKKFGGGGHVNSASFKTKDINQFFGE